MSKAKDLDHRPLFCAGSSGDGTMVITVGFPQGCLDDMIKKPGFGCPIDLSRAGIPIVITFFAAANHEACKAIVQDIAKQLGIPTNLDTSMDFSVRDRRH